MGLRRMWVSLRRRRAYAALALAALCAASCVRVPARAPLAARLPASPARLAHLLADYNNHPHIGSWVIEEETGNYTWWSYSVRLECGPRCEGSARVTLREGAEGAGGAGLEAGTLRHGPATGEHHVRVHERRCTRLTPLPWPLHCDETETETTVVADDVEGWSQVRERSVAWCGALAALSGACGRRLRAARADHLTHLTSLVSRL